MTAFVPAWWLPGAHFQTLGARVTRPRRGVRLRRERVELPDGDFVDLDWADGRADCRSAARSAVPPFRPVALVLVLHGLEGSARSKYALEIYRQLARRGVAAVGLNFRSCSGTLNRTARLYHSGETGDLRFVLGALRTRYPEARLGAIGVSLGGNVLLKLLGEAGAEGQGIAAAAAISVPYDLSAGADHLDAGWSRTYVWRLLRSLRRKLRAKEAQVRPRIAYERALAARTFREFDDAGTAPLHGFAGADDYYTRCSSKRYLAAIRVPTRLVHAADDPFLPRWAIPHEAIRANACLDPVFTARGGHVGFVTGPPWSPRFWAEETASAFVAERLRATAGATWPAG